MNWNQYIGEKGEALAVAWLANQGFTILRQNVKFGRNEIDIIAVKNNLIHFIEVKTRSNDHFGFPEERIGSKKLQYLKSAAEKYLDDHPETKEIVFDVLSIILQTGKEDSYFLVEDIRV